MSDATLDPDPEAVGRAIGKLLAQSPQGTKLLELYRADPQGEGRRALEGWLGARAGDLPREVVSVTGGQVGKIVEFLGPVIVHGDMHLGAEPAEPARRCIGLPPRPTSPLVGRAELLARLKARLLAGEDVALYAGLPGSGKTALAHALVRDPDIATHFDYIFWTWIGAGADPKTPLRGWAEELGISSQECEALAPEELAERVHRKIADVPSLLVVDDVWSSEVALLFRIGGEGASRVLTTRMETVARAFVSPASPTFVDVLDDAEAEQLVSVRAPTAMAKRRDEILAAIDTAGGLPLTIILLAGLLENAASGPPGLLSRELEKVRQAQFAVRQEVSGTLSPQEYRSRTFAAAMDLSRATLGDDAQRALGSLALFPPRTNSFSRDAADRVGATDDAVFDLYRMGFVSLVSDDPERYSMHQAVAEYARETSYDPAAYRRMAEYFIDYVAGGSRSAQGASRLAGLEAEQVNLDAALEWTEKEGDAETGLRLASALFQYWYERSRYTAGLTWIDHILAIPGADRPDLALLRAKVLNDSGNFAYSQGDLRGALRRHRQALRLRRRLSDDAVSGSWNNIGLVYREQGRLDRAETLIRLAHDQNVAFVADPDAAPGDVALHRRWLGINLNNLGRCAEIRDDLVAAAALQEASLAAFEELDDEWGIAMSHCDLATVLRRRGDPASADAHAAASFEIRHRTRDEDGLAAALRELAAGAHQDGDLDAAERYLTAALGVLMDIADPGDIAVTLQVLAPIRQGRGAHESAVTLLAAADRFRTAMGFRDGAGVRKALDEVEAKARGALGGDAFRRALEAGSRLELHEVCLAELEGVRPSLDEIAREILGKAAVDRN